MGARLAVFLGRMVGICDSQQRADDLAVAESPASNDDGRRCSRSHCCGVCGRMVRGGTVFGVNYLR